MKPVSTPNTSSYKHIEPKMQTQNEQGYHRRLLPYDNNG